MKSFHAPASVECAPPQRLNDQRSGARDLRMNTNTTNFFGADIKHKPHNAIRIGFKNINGFPNPHTHQVKYDTLRAESSEHGMQFDLQSYIETNKRWNKVHPSQHIKELTKGWWEKPSYQLAWLKDHDQSPAQYGGIATITSKQITSCRFSHDVDKMGRWTWTTLRGKRGIQTTIITAYRPCKSSNVNAVETQQLQYLRNAGIHTDPLETFDTDLKKLIENKLDNNHKIILMGDFNIPMNKNNSFTTMLKDLGLKEVITEKYTPVQGHSTYKYGSNIIDGLWTSEDVDMLQGGYGDLFSPSGDHCWLWADFPISSILGGNLDPFTMPITRKLNCKNPKVKETFQTILEREYSRHNLKEKMESYVEKYTKEYKATGQITDIMKTEYDKLLRISEDAIKHADKNCKKAHTGRVPFSPTTRKLQGEVVMWKEVIKYKSRTKKNLRLLLRQAKRWNFKERWGQLTLAETKEKLKQAKLRYKIFKPTAAEERKSFLGRLAQDYADRDPNGKDKEHFLRVLIHQEDERAAFRRIKYVLKPARTSVTRVEKDNKDGQRILISDKETMEREIGRVNVAKLQQANNTPLRQEPLRTHFGEEGDFSKWTNIVEGNLHLPPDFPAEQGTKLWIHKIQSMKTTANDTSWTPEEYADGWKRMNENTTSAPGPSFSHYKAAQPNSQAATIHSLLALAPLLLGFAPTAWCKAVASMIPKKKEDLRPAKLRLITLMHALFNHNNKWVGREMMKFGEANNLLAREQYGGRKKKSANQHALNKRLILDYIRIQKMSALLIANDARSCYDRIIIMVSFLTMLIFGVMKETAQCLLSCLISMVYSIRTVYGDSEFTYGGDKWERTPHGNGQGNGSGPALWNGISSPLFDILREQQFGIHLTAPISKTALHIAGFGFVDDADLIQGSFNSQSIDSLLRQAQGMLTLWEEILRVTGGALDVKDKSDWTLISFKWKKGIATLRPLNPLHSLSVRDHEDKIIPMKQLDATTARQTLGVMQSPSGNEDAEVSYLQDKVKLWTAKIKSSPLQRHDVRRAVQMTLMRTLRYGLVATALTYDECDLLTRQVLRGVLPKMGIIRSANMVLTTSTTAMRGAGLIHLYVLQLVDHLKVICNHGGEQTDTGTLLRNELEALTIQAGLGGSPFSINPLQTPWIEHCWWANTLEATYRYNIHIRGHTQPLQKWTVNDSFLMDDFRAQYDPTIYKKFLQSINRVRLFLQITTKSDIQLACGWRCNPQIFNKDVTAFNSVSKQFYTWPEQGRPAKNDFINWNIALDETYGITPINKVFRHVDRSKSWTEESKMFHHWRINHDRTSIFQYNASLQLWFRWEKDTNGRTRSSTQLFTRTQTSTEHIDQSYDLASVQWLGINIQLLSIGTFQTDKDMTEDITDWAIQYLVLPEDGGERFAKQVQSHKGQTAGDGSCKNGRATGGFISFDDDNIKNGIQGATEVPLTEDDSTPYSGELGGIQVAIAATHKICATHNVKSGTITHGVDNNAALTNCFGHEEPDTTTPCFHMVKRIRAEIAKSPFTWIGKKVKAHQDETKEYKDLTCWEKANIEADKVAKQHLVRVQNQPKQKHNPTKSEGWSVQLNDSIVTTKFEKKIISHCTDGATQQYWYKRMNIPAEAEHYVDWKNFQKTTSLLPSYRQLFIMKHSAGITATGRNMVRRNERNTDTCPRCGSKDEHTEHVIRCPHDTAQKIFITALEDLETWLHNTTSKEITTAIKELVIEYRSNHKHPTKQHETDEIQQAIHNQRMIGLYPFVCGFLCTDWVTLQTTYLTKTGSRRCPKRWTAQLSGKLIDIIFEMWNHRNEVLHKEENNIKEKQHKDLNETIHAIWSDLPNMRLLTETERRFFRHSTIQKVQHLNIHRKRQWIKRATSILDTFETNHNNTSRGNSNILLKAMGIQRPYKENRAIRTNETKKESTNTQTITQTQKQKQQKQQKQSKQQKTQKIYQYMSNKVAQKDKRDLKDTG